MKPTQTKAKKTNKTTYSKNSKKHGEFSAADNQSQLYIPELDGIDQMQSQKVSEDDMDFEILGMNLDIDLDSQLEISEEFAKDAQLCAEQSENSKQEKYPARSCIGSYMSKIGNHKLLTKEEEEKLGKAIQKGSQSKKEKAIVCLMEHNLKLAASIATEYQNRGLDLEDLISEANIGLRRAAERFNPENNQAKFSTYAYYWIKQSILRSIHTKARMVRLPTHLIEKISKLRKVQESISRTLGREVSNDELCEQTGNKTHIIEKLLNIQSQTSHIDQSSSSGPIPGLSSEKDDGTNDILKSLADQNQPSPSDEISKKSDLATIGKVLSELPEREKKIISLRFGLQTDKPKTLEEVGLVTNLSRERVRQIENSALLKLREAIEKLDGKKRLPK